MLNIVIYLLNLLFKMLNIQNLEDMGKFKHTLSLLVSTINGCVENLKNMFNMFQPSKNMVGRLWLGEDIE